MSHSPVHKASLLPSTEHRLLTFTQRPANRNRRTAGGRRRDRDRYDTYPRDGVKKVRNTKLRPTRSTFLRELAYAPGCRG